MTKKLPRPASKVAILAVIGGLIGLLQWVFGPAEDAYRGGVPFELIGAVGGGAIVGALVGWLFERIARRKETRR
jgi:NhaP-type Na+/H+ or K+/H+ antiporter